MKKYKILMMGNVDTLSYGQITDETHIKKALIELGHEIFVNDVSKLKEIDLILAFKSNSFGVEEIKRWKTQTSAPIFIWTFDWMERFPWFFDIAKEVDLWLGEEDERREEFKNNGINFRYFPNHAVSEEIFKPLDVKKIYEISFTGTDYFDDRTKMLQTAKDTGRDLHIFGNSSDSWKNKGFENIHGPAFDHELAKVVSQSKIVIGISNTVSRGYWSIRPAQVMLCKGFIIERYVDWMERELRDGCEYWNTHEELREKILYYLEHEDERNAIAQRGYEIAITTLTNKSRCAELIKLFQNYGKSN